LYERREAYSAGTVPAGALMLTAGVDVQKDRFVFEVVAWGAGKESWSVDTGVIPADTSNQADWERLDELLSRTYASPTGVTWAINMLAVDSGYNTNEAYTWARNHVGRVLAIKGQSSARVLVGTPTPVDVKVNGRRVARGCKVWPVGVDIAKRELYGWLRLKVPVDGEPYPAGFMHFPQQHGPDYFKQLTAEQLTAAKNKQGFIRYEWSVIPGRENHVLDTRVYARVAAAVCGIDRVRVPKVAAPSRAAATPAPAAPVPAPAPPPPAAPPAPRGGFIGGRGDRFGRRGKRWL
jgi:phage terminase large subunit GpA-like protein